MDALIIIFMETEIWKDIPWYEWRYQVSNLWNLKWRHRYWGVIYLKKKLTNSWYLWNDLFNWEKYRKHSVHRLVMLAFIWPSKLDVNHINWIKTDNRLENLEYCTKSKNMRHAYDNWLINIRKWEKHYMYWVKWVDNKHSVKIKQLSMDWNLIKIWDSIADIYRELWISKWNICMVCRWQRNHTWWYKWSYCA